jgi:hypothetical protein
MVGVSRILVEAARWARKREALPLARAAYRSALAIDPHNRLARRELPMLRIRRPGERERLRFLVIGSTGLCNASCLHCPTGKAITAHAPRTPMAMDLYRRIIDTVLIRGWAVQCLCLGLFGDGLVDPFVVDRIRYARDRLPDVPLDVNTNGAAFDRKRHAPLAKDLSLLTLHCESIRPATYDALMTPLRAKNVFPKYEPILETFAGKLRVSIPVSSLNLEEIEETRDWFLSRGAYEVVFDPLFSRCTDDQRLFRALALDPHKIACTTEIIDDAIIDCDGMLLACCQDFERREPLGEPPPPASPPRSTIPAAMPSTHCSPKAAMTRRRPAATATPICAPKISRLISSRASRKRRGLPNSPERHLSSRGSSCSREALSAT